MATPSGKHVDDLERAVRQLQATVAALAATLNAITTTPPANTTTGVGWMIVKSGGATYKIELFQ